MQQYICISCAYIYDPEQGDSMADIPPGTAFEDLPEDWCCPICYMNKVNFDPV